MPCPVSDDMVVKTFRPSQALADLLLKYGFREDTEALYPNHYRRMQLNGYDPYSMKRIFCISSHEDYLLFRYASITLHHNGSFYHTEEKHHLTLNELKSLLTFYRLPFKEATEWLEAYQNAFELYKYYRNVCMLPEVFNSPLDSRIKDIFERIAVR